MVEGQRYKMIFGYGKLKGIAFENNDEQMKPFTPHQQKLHNHLIFQPTNQPWTHLDNGQGR